ARGRVGRRLAGQVRPRCGDVGRGRPPRSRAGTDHTMDWQRVYRLLPQRNAGAARRYGEPGAQRMGAGDQSGGDAPDGGHGPQTSWPDRQTAMSTTAPVDSHYERALASLEHALGKLARCTDDEKKLLAAELHQLRDMHRKL